MLSERDSGRSLTHSRPTRARNQAGAASSPHGNRFPIPRRSITGSPKLEGEREVERDTERGWEEREGCREEGRERQRETGI